MSSHTTLSPRELSSLIESGNCQLIDVREPVEHAEVHIAAAKLIPLGQLAARCGELDRSRPVLVTCRSGKRGTAAMETLRAQGFSEVRNLDGGMLAWEAAGLPCGRAEKKVMPLIRQVQMVIGGFATAGAVLALTVDPAWVYLCLVCGTGLVFAGLTGCCPLGMLVAKMPWNRVNNTSCKTNSCCG